MRFFLFLWPDAIAAWLQEQVIHVPTDNRACESGRMQPPLKEVVSMGERWTYPLLVKDNSVGEDSSAHKLAASKWTNQENENKEKCMRLWGYTVDS